MSIKLAKHSDDDYGLLVEAAKLYYEEQLTQAEIGRQLKTSRSTVSRLLQQARDKGVVHIPINYAWARDSVLEQDLLRYFPLKDIRVLRSYDRATEDVIDGIGQLGATYLESVVQDDMILGASYGRAIAKTIHHVSPKQPVDLTVVQIIGALGSSNPLIEGPDLARELANKYGATYRYLYAPLVVEDTRTRDLLMQEPTVQDVLAIGKQSDVALLGIGALASDVSGLIWAGYLNEKDLAWLRNKGVAGHMCAQFYDAEGQVLDVDFNKRSMSIGLNALRNIDPVVAVAARAEKAEAILGALRGGYIDVLITDDTAAKGILEALA